MIDPTSPRESGIDTSGKPVRLGDLDSDGMFVGYIDAGGTVWESREERDEAIFSGRAMEAFVRWNHCGGLGPAPDPWEIMRAYDCLDENWDACIRALNRAMKIYVILTPRREARARLN
jgi:hypothetical protein